MCHSLRGECMNKFNSDHHQMSLAGDFQEGEGMIHVMLLTSFHHVNRQTPVKTLHVPSVNSSAEGNKPTLDNKQQTFSDHGLVWHFVIYTSKENPTRIGWELSFGERIIRGFHNSRLIRSSLHTRSVWETICDAGVFGAKFLEGPHRSIWGMLVLTIPQNKNLARTWHLGIELIWSAPTKKRTCVVAGVWRIIAVSPKIPSR